MVKANNLDWGKAVRIVSPAMVIVLIGATLSTALAQGVGGLRQTPGAAGMSAADCEQLARMPNSPISVATCKSMMGMAAGLDAAANDASAQRPGDHAMTCPQIFAELQTMAGAGISELNVAASEAVVKDGTALAARQGAVLTGFMAESLALGAVMGATSTVMPSFVQMAIVAAWQARFVAIGAAAQAEQAPLNERMGEVLRSSSAELTESMQANPRFGSLMQLAMAKECQAPATVAK